MPGWLPNNCPWRRGHRDRIIMPRIVRTNFVIGVPDLEISAAFYRDVLGFTVQPISDPGWRVYTSGDCTIMAGQCPDAIPPSKLGDHSYFAYLEIDDIDAFYQSVQRAGARICSTIRDEPWGIREFCLVTADGHRIMFGSQTSIREVIDRVSLV